MPKGHKTAKVLAKEEAKAIMCRDLAFLRFSYRSCGQAGFEPATSTV